METHSITLDGETIEVDTPDGMGALAVDGVCFAFGYSETILVEGVEQPNPESKKRFAIRQGINFFLDRAAEQQKQIEIDAAVRTADVRRSVVERAIVLR